MTTTNSSTGGLITVIVDKNGNRTGLIHQAGKAYSGKTSQLENKAKAAAKNKQ